MDKTWDDVANAINFSLEPKIEDAISRLDCNARIVDYGCGYGRISQKIWTTGYKNIVGYDSSRKMIERGNKEFPYLNLKIITSQSIPEPDESVDFVLLCAVLTCMPNNDQRQNLISELFRILKVNGAVNICEFAMFEGKSYSNDGTYCSKLGITMKHFNKSELEKELELFSNKRIETFNTISLNGNPAKAIYFYGEKPNRKG